MSQSSGTPFTLQSVSHSSGMPFALQSRLVPVRDVALVGNTVASCSPGCAPVVMSQSSGTPLALQSVSHSSGMPFALQSGLVPVVMSHSSGTLFVLQSWLVPVVMSQSSGTPLALQSFALVGMPFGCSRSCRW